MLGIASTLDRILISYGLLSSFTGGGRGIKRKRLFEYLGADALKPPEVWSGRPRGVVDRAMEWAAGYWALGMIVGRERERRHR